MGNTENRQRKTWVSKWEAFKEIIRRKRTEDKTIKALVKLYSHEVSIEVFSDLPLHPQSTIVRNDLEFYVPQFVNFIICENPEGIEEILKVLFYSCQNSIRYSHKVYWFLSSASSASQTRELMHLVEMVSRESIGYPRMEEDPRRAALREKIKLYNEVDSDVQLSKITEVFFDSFPKKGLRDNYMSCIWFFERLTQIADMILGVKRKKEIVTREIKKLNLLLPASVYIPFPGRTSSNVVLHIPPDSVKVFETKEKAPYLVSLEVFEPMEEMKSQEYDDNFSRSGSFSFSVADSTQYAESLKEFFTEEVNKPLPNLEGFLKKNGSKRGFSKKPKRKELVADVYNEKSPEESSQQQAARVRKRSPFGNLKSWNLVRVIVKTGDDLLQEQFAMQAIYKFRQIFYENKLDLFLKPYEILATGENCGVVECIPDAQSLDSIKKSLPEHMNSLIDYFRIKFGPEDSKSFKWAKHNFLRSLAGYSLLCYVLQIKDRHNGNILLDKEGHLVHIDFGFILNCSPGGNIRFEDVPFKLTAEFVEVLGGYRSADFQKFRKLCVKGFRALMKRSEEVVLLFEMIKNGVGESLPCFYYDEHTIEDLRARIAPSLSKTDYKMHVNKLIDKSLDNWRTNWYDRYQYCCQNILY